MGDSSTQLEFALGAPDYVSGASPYFQQIILSMLDLLITARLPDLTLEYLNPSTLDMLGLASDASSPQNLIDLIAKEDQDSFLRQFVQPSGEPRYLGFLDLRFRKASSDLHWLKCFGSLVIAPDQQPRLVL